LDLNGLTLGESESIFVKPLRSTINDFCTKLTTLTPALIEEKGISFEDACLLLRNKYKVHHRLWASWGDYDRKQFERQCRRASNDAKYPFGPTHLNVKNLFAIIMGLTREVGMDEALKLLNMELEGTHHRGVDDACNIAKIACSLLEYRRSLSA
jgi:inhibitor of KinA sporulation pathway (predicted exonuclease)